MNSQARRRHEMMTQICLNQLKTTIKRFTTRFRILLQGKVGNGFVIYPIQFPSYPSATTAGVVLIESNPPLPPTLGSISSSSMYSDTEVYCV